MDVSNAQQSCVPATALGVWLFINRLRIENIDSWLKAFHKAVEMCGGVKDQKRIISNRETKYLDELVRGIYAKKNIEAGTIINSQNFDDLFYLAIPLQKGQLSCREIINDIKIIKDLKNFEPLMVSNISGPYNDNPSLKEMIKRRGM